MLSAEQWTEKFRRRHRARLDPAPARRRRRPAPRARRARSPSRWHSKALDSILRNIELAKGNLAADLPGHRHAAGVDPPPGGDVDANARPRAFEEAVRRATAKSLLRPERGRHPDRQEHRQRRSARHPDRALRGVGRGRCRGPSDAQGRRLRERRRPVHPAQHQAQGRPRPRGCQALHPRRRSSRRRARAARRGSSARASAATAAPGSSSRSGSCCAGCDDRNPMPELDAHGAGDPRPRPTQLGIGPMGFGGKTTVLGVKIGYLGRLPAQLLRVGLLHVLGQPQGRAREIAADGRA